VIFKVVPAETLKGLFETISFPAPPPPPLFPNPAPPPPPTASTSIEEAPTGIVHVQSVVTTVNFRIV
jgi:hypothetical protein